MAEMLSRARFKGEDGMVSKSEDVDLDFFEMARLSVDNQSTPTLHALNKDEYEEEWLMIGQFLRKFVADALWRRRVGSGSRPTNTS